MSAGAVIGREEELGEVRACLTACAEGPAALALGRRARDRQDGRSGRRASRTRGARGYRVLVHRSVEAEAGFAFAGLSDLVAPVFERGAGELAAPRRAALEVGAAARRRGRRTAGSPGDRTRAARRPARAVTRRAGARRAGRPAVARRVVGGGAPRRAAAARWRARRAAGDGARAGRQARRWEPTGLRVRSLGPLGCPTLHELLRERLLVELAAASAGAPARGVRRQPVLRARAGTAPDARVPESLRDLLGGRLAGLPARHCEVLLLAAALARPTEAAGLRCLRRRRDRARARSSAAGDVLVNDDGRLRFAHPLLASLCYERAAPSRRRDAHRRLAVGRRPTSRSAPATSPWRPREPRRGDRRRAGRRLRPRRRARRNSRRGRAGRASPPTARRRPMTARAPTSPADRGAPALARR